MPIYRTEDGRGWMHINFGRKPGPLPCRAPRLSTDDASLGKICGRMSVALCDAPAGVDHEGRTQTCDMPVCDHHRVRAGENVDYCKPRHEHYAPAAKEWST
jgi:hypothetical protein